MAKIDDLQSRIAALKAAKLDTSVEEAELRALITAGTAPTVAAAVATPVASPTGEMDNFDIIVDKEGFESGGQELDSPTKPDVYQGYYVGRITPTKKTEQLWLIFKTNDARVEQQKGRQVRSALIITPGGAGAFKLADTLTGLNIAHALTLGADGRWHVTGSIPKGLKCNLDYQNYTEGGKTSVRLQSVSVGEIRQAV
jgi:hypothetical protein